MKYSISEHESIDGLYVIGGAAIVCGLHPTKITISDDAVVFKYGDVDRSYGLVKSGGKITSFTNPDGTSVEVEYGG